MPVFRNFSADGKLLEEFAEPLSEKNFNRFIAEYGEEKARMYLEILAEFNNEIGNAVYEHIDVNGKSPRTGYMIKKLTIHFYRDKISIIKLGNEQLKNVRLDKPAHP